MSAITWIHISDLHFRESESSDLKVVTNSLLKDISKRENIAPELSKIDFIFITGDIAFSGKTEEYVTAQNFFKKLTQATGIPKTRLFMIPGNHDIDRFQISDESRDILNKLGSRQTVNDLLKNPIDRAIVMKRLEGYGQFFTTYYGGNPTFDHDHYYYVAKRKIEDKQIAILGLNTAWAAGSDQDRLNLFLGESQARDAINEATSAHLRIVLMHHPFNWIRDFDADNCEPLLLDRGNIILHGHLHRTGIIHQQTPSAASMTIGAGACYETREYLNSYSLAHIDFDKQLGSLYLRTYSDRDGGFWSADTTSYRTVPGKYNFPLLSEEKDEESTILKNIESSESEFPQKELSEGKLNTNARKPRPQKTIRLQTDALIKWWKDRGYNSDPFLYDNAKDLTQTKRLLPDILQWWYVDPNLPASTNGFGGTPTIDEIMSTETSDLVLIYAPSGGGKTFCRLWAAKEIGISETKDVVEISNLVGRLPNPERISSLDLMFCVYEEICSKYSLVVKPSSQLTHIQHILTECDDQLKSVLSPRNTSKQVFAFIDDIDQLFSENNGEKNLNALKAISDLCKAVASQSGILLGLRLFLPFELKEPLQQLLGVKTRQSIREITLRWGADHCESILEARLDSCWINGPNTYSGRHLERLFHQDALTELRRQFRGQHLSPRCIIRLLRDLCNFAYQNSVSVDRTISSDLMVDFMNGRNPALCPQIQYPLTDRHLSKPRQPGQSLETLNGILKEKTWQLSARVNNVIERIARVSDWIGALRILAILIAAVLLILWMMIQEIWYGRHIDIFANLKKVWDFIVGQIQ